MENETVGIVLRGETRFISWGTDAEGVDRVAVEGNGLISVAPSSDDHTIFDLTPVELWLTGRRASIDPESALNLWNLAIDVGVSLGKPFGHLTDTDDSLHAILTAANVPWAFGQESYSPRWSPRLLRRLRVVLGDALALVRGALLG